jgi:hypothetical protein
LVTEKYLCEKCNVLARKICHLIFKVFKLNEILGFCCSVLDPESGRDALAQNIITHYPLTLHSIPED